EAIHNSIKQYGGYIAQDEQNITGEKLESVLSIKVPVEQFEPMVNNLSGSDVKVLERKITSQDVTGEMVDTKSRLEAKKQVRLKYLDFLKASKNMDEVLKVQSEINTIQEEIEAASGRVQYLSHQSSFSTINLTFYQPVIGFQPTEANPSFLTRAIASFNYGGKWIAEFLLALVSIWPLLLIILGAFVIYKKVKPFKIKPHKL
ncbi:MAG: DUF4349 domain-containing protein, partial [Ferruginibacter sp.]|nr:DUF4349 domain-containing protein [Ferruginibacter sp.]